MAIMIHGGMKSGREKLYIEKGKKKEREREEGCSWTLER